jgi:hypothetical protein
MMRVTVTYTMRCEMEGCEAIASQYWGLLPCGPGRRVPEPVLPEEWREIGGVLVCPRHTVAAQSDAGVFPTASP